MQRGGDDADSELHDLSDDSDYEAASVPNLQSSGVHQGMTKSDSSTGTGAADGGGPVEVVFVKEDVMIHPTQYGHERISGRLRLYKQGSPSELFMSWIPYRHFAKDGYDSILGLEVEKNRELYTIKSLPLSDVRFIRKHTPTIGWHYIIIVLASGLAYPPLYFYGGGGGGVREFIKTLKLYVSTVRSADDPNVVLVNDLEDPLQKSLSSLKLPGVANVVSRQNSRNLTASVDYSNHGNTVNYEGSSSTTEYSSRQKNRSNDFPVQVLETFSLVTKFARDTTASLFRENLSSDPYAYGQQKQNYLLDAKTSVESQDNKIAPEKSAVLEDPLEGARQSLGVWGKQRELPLSSYEWKALVDSEGRVVDSLALRKRVFYGGLDHSLRKEVWKFLLGYYEYHSTYAEREYLAAVKKTEYESIKTQWKSISPAQAKRFTKFRERKGLIDKDVVRTDRSVLYYEGDENRNVTVLRDILVTYSFYNFDLGYCQGMSDLLAPILYVVEDESESFWCFAALMERLGPNFNRDQNGMHAQLLALSKLVELLDGPLHKYFREKDCLNYFFCFRWILIQFKREFEFDQILLLWEVLWTHYMSEHFHLYLCVAILKRYRGRIMGEQMDFDTLLKFINELSGEINLDRSIQEAEALCTLAGDAGPACIPPGTPPSIPIETDNGMYVQEDEVL